MPKQASKCNPGVTAPREGQGMLNRKQLGAVAAMEPQAPVVKQVPEEAASLTVYFGLLLSSVHRDFLV